MLNDSQEIILEFNLKSIMEEKKLSIKDVSQKTGLSQNGLFLMLERTPRMIKFSTIALLCIGLGITPGNLFTVKQTRLK